MGVSLLVVALFIETALAGSIGHREIRARLGNASGPWLATVVVAYLLELVLRLARWKMLFPELRALPSASVFLLGTGVNEITPTGTGEIARVFVASARFRARGSAVLAATGIERLFDLVLLLGLGFFSISSWATNTSGFGLAGLVVGVALGVAVVVHPGLLGRIGPNLSARSGVRQRIGAFVGRLSADLEVAARRRAAMASALLLTAAIWILEGTAQWAMLRALGSAIEFPTVLGFTAASYLAGFVSFLPGGLGAREAVLSALLATAGVPFGLAVSAVVSLRLGQTLLVLALGAAAAVYVSWGPDRHAPVDRIAPANGVLAMENAKPPEDGAKGALRPR